MFRVARPKGAGGSPCEASKLPGHQAGKKMKRWKIALLALAGVSALGAYAVISRSDDAPGTVESTVQDLLKQEDALNEKCQDGGAADAQQMQATTKLCDQRDKVVSALKAKGWCYGTEGQAEYQKKWQPCQTAPSLQLAQPVSADDDQVQFDPQAATHKAMLDQLDVGANTCFARAIHGLLMSGVRSRAELLGFAEKTCGQGLKRFLISQGSPDAAAEAYVDKGAEDVLAEELR